jgi:hypothetical protein
MGTESNRPAANSGTDAAAETSGVPPATARESATSAPNLLEPSEAEVEAWAERERRRREEWLSGPTAEERAAWVQRERERRLTGLRAGPASDATDLARRTLRPVREAQLAAEGAVSLLWKGLEADGPVGLLRKWSRRGMDTLVRAGREWEEEMVRPPGGRRVPYDDDVPGARRRFTLGGWCETGRGSRPRRPASGT